MVITFKEAEDALRYISKRLYISSAIECIDSISKWQKRSIEEIHSFGKAADQITDQVPHDFLSNECHVRKVLYRDALRRKMKVRRAMRIAVDMFAWAEQTRSLLIGIPEFHIDDGGYHEMKLHIGERADVHTDEHLYLLLGEKLEINRCFVLETPYIKFSDPIRLVCKRIAPWMEDALSVEQSGYKLFRAEITK